MKMIGTINPVSGVNESQLVVWSVLPRLSSSAVLGCPHTVTFGLVYVRRGLLHNSILYLQGSGRDFLYRPSDSH